MIITMISDDARVLRVTLTCLFCAAKMQSAPNGDISIQDYKCPACGSEVRVEIKDVAKEL